MLKMIFATTLQGHFGTSDGRLPWKHLPDDMKHFFAYTAGCKLVMGRATYESLSEPKLPGRTLIVVTSDESVHTLTAPSLQAALWVAGQEDDDADVCIIGGRRLLLEAATIVDECSITYIREEHLRTPQWGQDVNIEYINYGEIAERLGANGLINYTSAELGDAGYICTIN